MQRRTAVHQAAWAKQHPDRIREADIRWKKANPDKLREKEQRRGREKRAELNAKQRRWVDANPEKAARSVRRAVSKNPEKYRLVGHRRRARLLDGRSPGVTPAEWAVVIGIFQNRCAYCRSLEKMTIEHVVPLARGGLDEPGNVVPACARCNRSKNASLLQEWCRSPEWLKTFPFLDWLQMKLQQHGAA